MSGRTAILVLVAALAGKCCALAGVLGARVPQDPAEDSARGKSDIRARISIASDLVILPVIVKDASGNLVPGLQKSDFRVADDGVEQSITFFTAESFPLSLVILVDDDLRASVAETNG